METTWIVLADDSRLRVFEIQGSKGILYEVVDFLSSEGKGEIRKNFEIIQFDLFTHDQSTRADKNECDFQNVLIQQRKLFSKQISGYIERSRQKRCFAKIRIIGSKGFLKLLRDDMSESAKCLVEKEFIDDSINFEHPVSEKYFK